MTSAYSQQDALLMSNMLNRQNTFLLAVSVPNVDQINDIQCAGSTERIKDTGAMNECRTINGVGAGRRGRCRPPCLYKHVRSPVLHASTLPMRGAYNLQNCEIFILLDRSILLKRYLHTDYISK